MLVDELASPSKRGFLPMSDRSTYSTLHVNTSRDWRGGERQTLLLAEALHSAGHPSGVICPPNSPLEERCRQQGLPVFPVQMKSEVDLAACRKLIQVIRQESPQIIQAHTAHAHTLCGLARLGIRWGGPQHLRPAVIAQRRVPFSIHRSGTPFFTPWKYRRLADHLIAVSQQVGRILEGDGVPADQIRVIPDGVPALPTPETSPTLWRQQHGVPDKGLLIGSVGHLSQEKGHVHLIEALSHLRIREQPAQLVIVGEGTERAHLTRRAQELGISDRVHLIGFQKDVSSALHALDVYAHPSLEEGLGTSILDALQALRPVVASRVGGIPEVIEQMVTGHLVSPGDPKALAVSIDELLDDPEKAAGYAQAGQKRCLQSYSVEAMREANLHLYSHICGNNSDESER